MNAETSPGDNRARLEGAFAEMGVPAESWSGKASAKGRYTSYTVRVTVQDKQEFELLHTRVAAVDGVRYIL